MLEKDIQIALLKSLAMDFTTKEILVVSVPNEGVGKGSSKLNAIRRTVFLKSMGMCPGFPDLILFGKGKVLLVEVKSEKGSLTENQKRIHSELKEREFDTIIVRDAQKGLDLIVQYFSKFD